VNTRSKANKAQSLPLYFRSKMRMALFRRLPISLRGAMLWYKKDLPLL